MAALVNSVEVSAAVATRAARKVVLAGHGPVSGCWRRPRMVSRSGGSLRIFRRVAAIRV